MFLADLIGIIVIISELFIITLNAFIRDHIYKVFFWEPLDVNEKYKN